MLLCAIRKGMKQSLIFSLFLSLCTVAAAENKLRLTTFQADVTPPLGSPLCNGNVKPVMKIVTPLTARGVILLGAGKPIVLCAFDWVGIANESHDKFCEAIAKAANTDIERVTVHTLHQHDAPGSDFATERLLAKEGLDRRYSNANFDTDMMERVAKVVKNSLMQTQQVTHVSYGKGRVEKVASNRRILGPNGKVAIVRLSRSRDAKAQAAPEGTIDPYIWMLAFWNHDQPLAVLTYYATHPQSYYGQGSVNWDFVGMAREMREQALPGVSHIHFDGAGGNIAAGKYNDGSKEKRPVLAKRLAAGMKLAWEAQQKQSIDASDVDWRVQPVLLPVRETLKEEELVAILKSKSLKVRDRIFAARDLVFVRRMQNKQHILLSCLQVGPARVLHMPGELFVEYQLAAQQMLPGEFVAMAAYGQYGPGYIGTKISYSQGGYETGRVSRVGPGVEPVLMEAMKELLAAGQ